MAKNPITSFTERIAKEVQAITPIVYSDLPRLLRTMEKVNNKFALGAADEQDIDAYMSDLNKFIDSVRKMEVTCREYGTFMNTILLLIKKSKQDDEDNIDWNKVIGFSN